MAHLQYFNYKGIGEKHLEQFHYSQAVRIGDTLDCSGQGGWDPETGEISDDLATEIEQAFKNVDICLKDAGGKGWSQVYKVSTFHIPMDDENIELAVKLMKKYCPSHAPIWTAIGTPGLAYPEMRIEITVTAHLG